MVWTSPVGRVEGPQSTKIMMRSVFLHPKDFRDGGSKRGKGDSWQVKSSERCSLNS
ncbi:Protein of unknown function [Pyronema omphalodes CBS 100304]|uniref:Uncharacterized protein n=1 Tax=Pyronema omphalodes (strain CBS 100304) TaxID=1076935 RepID=U4LGF3_PYROM|nr:Protein of unknown function [Pyronema omphalodes CBS 100304]